MVSTDLASIERALREIECAELEDFRAGKAEAPVVYRPNIIERANGEDGLMGFVASDESVDRMGDVVRAKGWVLDDFKRNPVFLWAHNASLPAIGAVRQVYVEGRKLMAGVEWAQTVAAQEIKGLYDGGFMRAVSVGFRPIEFAPRSDDEGNFAGFEFKRQELLELSAVPVPANARALRKAFGGFSMTVPDLSALRKAMEDAAPDGAGDRAQEANVSPSPQPSPPGEGPEEHRTLTEQEARDAWVRGVEERLEGLDARLKALEGDATSGESEEVDGGDEEVPAELAEEIAELAGLAAGKE